MSETLLDAQILFLDHLGRSEDVSHSLARRLTFGLPTTAAGSRPEQFAQKKVIVGWTKGEQMDQCAEKLRRREADVIIEKCPAGIGFHESLARKSEACFICPDV